MPGIEDWINSPVQIIERFFVENQDTTKHSQNVHEYFAEKSKESSSLSWIPLLNSTPPHDLQTHTLVRYRAMIQDMFDPEYYLGAYEVVNKTTKEAQLRCGKYRDLAQCLPDEEINFDSPRNVTLERQTLYCVPIPGENQWVKEAMTADGGKSRIAPSTSVPGPRPKRTLDEPTNDHVNSVTMKTEETNGDTACEDQESSNKKARAEDGKTSPGSSASSTPDLNFPLPRETGPACIVKVYDPELGLKLNEVVDVVGVLSNHPALATFHNTQDDGRQSAVEGGMEGIMEAEEEAHNPPPSLVPRLHALVVRRLSHNNSLLHPTDLTQHGEKMQSEFKSLREEILTILSQALGGDTLAAEYLLCHLVSSVYARHDVVALGKYSLNLSGCPSTLPSLLYPLLQTLVTKSHFLPLSITNMNTLSFVPRKDYAQNRLRSGLLQLSDHTHLVVDETALQPGQLDTKGVANMTALGNVITWQKLPYDFDFHHQEFTTDIPTLVLSEGKSILKCDCHVPMTLNSDLDMGQAYAGIDTYLTSDLLERLRCYLTLARHRPYALSEHMQKAMEEYFVERRRVEPNSYSVDDFHSLLALTRLMTVSHGEETLSQDILDRAKHMETLRKQRLATQST